jgi:hypothetical protein
LFVLNAFGFSLPASVLWLCSSLIVGYDPLAPLASILWRTALGEFLAMSSGATFCRGGIWQAADRRLANNISEPEETEDVDWAPSPRSDPEVSQFSHPYGPGSRTKWRVLPCNGFLEVL